MGTMPDAVAVTGALGGAGRWVVDRLAATGADVLAIDQRLPEADGPEDVDFRAADLTARGETFDLLDAANPDAVVHLAAIPDPLNHAGGRVFENNVLSTYNVLDVAGRVGADVAWTSSESAYGFPFATEILPPEYLPIDESHPMRPEDPYGTSKVHGETIADMVVRRDGISVTSIRPSWIQYPGEYVARDVADAFDLAALAADPVGAVGGGTGNFWSYVDVRDVADMVVHVLETDRDGHEAYNCHAEDNFLGVPTRDLFEALLGDVPEPCDIEGEQSAFSMTKAEAELDWSPSHTWRSAADESVDGPTFG
ncbi:NAD-dependent epimerase/dehydratase family protein [Halorubellus litoreus]|uniref:NAD-dependent epimerase/dehydratase family protein n=1 Tax=Halorubellus litoreus TaxID=755308 RepID=A0ABD5VC47_9EURY